MSGYEEEHNISTAAPQSQPPHYRRPDLSTFFSNLHTLQPPSSASGSSDNQAAPPTSTAFTTPTPGDAASLFQSYAQGLQLMLRDYDGASFAAPPGDPQGADANPLLQQMIDILTANADDPPREVKGMPETWFEELDRIPKAKLRKGDSCPICANEFLDDKYPLVVRLPCAGGHVFDMECAKPWLSVQTTCPMCRTDFEKARAAEREKRMGEIKKAQEEQKEEEWDDMYA